MPTQSPKTFPLFKYDIDDSSAEDFSEEDLNNRPFNLDLPKPRLTGLVGSA